MEYFKNIKDEITRSLDSDQVKKDQPSATDSSELPQNAETNAETSLVKVNKDNTHMVIFWDGLCKLC